MSDIATVDLCLANNGEDVVWRDCSPVRLHLYLITIASIILVEVHEFLLQLQMAELRSVCLFHPTSLSLASIANRASHLQRYFRLVFLFRGCDLEGPL